MNKAYLPTDFWRSAARPARWVLIAVLLITGLAQAPDAADDGRTDEAATPATQPQAPADTTDGAAAPADGDTDSSADPALPPGSSGVLSTANPAGATVAVIPVEGMIYGFTLTSLERRIDKAVAGGASMIVLELDTPGGEVSAALEISKYLKGLNVPVVAWVNNDAYSAGILIAAACSQGIVMSPASATGDCAPIVPSQELAPTERAKALSPILEEFRDSAQANGYDYAVFHAMCVLGVEVYYIENPETGQRKLVNQVDYNLMVHGRAPGGGGIGALFSGGSSAEKQVGEARREVASDADVGKWVPVTSLPSGANLPNGQVHDGKTLLTLNQTRATDIGLAKGIVRDNNELKQHLAAGSVTTVTQTWSEDIAGWLTHPFVRGFLVLVLLAGAYMEFQSPGIGVPGAAAAVALVVLLGAPFIVGLAEVWHLLAFLVGFCLLVVEIVATPGFGLLGVLGVVLMLAGLILSVVPTGSGGGPISLPPPEMIGRLQQSIASILTGFVLGTAVVVALIRHFGNVPVLNKLILAGNQMSQADRAAAVMRGETQPGIHVSGDEDTSADQITVGTTGVAVSDLRPSGRAELSGRTVDASARRGFIESGESVEVVQLTGFGVIVDRPGA